MDKSVFSSTIKTYPSKTKRGSRAYSYRPSFATTSNICGNPESEELFDQLLGQNEQGKLNDISEGNHKSYRNEYATMLKNIQNVNCDDSRRNRKISIQQLKHKTSKYSSLNKENTWKCSSRLFLSDSDSPTDDTSTDSSVFKFNLKEFKPPKSKQQEKEDRYKFKLSKIKSVSAAKSKKVNRAKKRMVQNRLLSKLNFSKTVNTPRRLPLSENADTSTVRIISDVPTSSVTKNSSLDRRTMRRDEICCSLFGNNYTEILKINETRFTESLADSENRSSVIQSFEKDSRFSVVNAWDVTIGKLSLPFQPKGMSTPEFHRKFSTVPIPECDNEFYETVVRKKSTPTSKRTSTETEAYACVAPVFRTINSRKEALENIFLKPNESDILIEECLPCRNTVDPKLQDLNTKPCERPLYHAVKSEEAPARTLIPVTESADSVSDSIDPVCLKMLSQLTFQTCEQYSAPRETIQEVSSAVTLYSESLKEEDLIPSLKDLHLTDQKTFNLDPITTDISRPSTYTDSLLDSVVGNKASHETISQTSKAVSSRLNTYVNCYIPVKPSESRKSTYEDQFINSSCELPDSNDFTVVNKKNEEVCPSPVKNKLNFVFDETLHNEISHPYAECVIQTEASFTTSCASTEDLQESGNHSVVTYQPASPCTSNDDLENSEKLSVASACWTASSCTCTENLQESKEGNNLVAEKTKKSLRTELSSNLELSQLFKSTQSIITNEMDVTRAAIKEKSFCDISLKVNLSTTENFCGFEEMSKIASNEKVTIMRDLIEELNEKNTVDESSSSSSCDSRLTYTVVSRSTDNSGGNNESLKVRPSSPPPPQNVISLVRKSEMKIADLEQFHKNAIGTYPEFETVLEEKDEEAEEDVTSQGEVNLLSSVYSNFTERKKKRCPLPPLLEEESEKNSQCFQDTSLDQPSVCVNERNTKRQSLYLEKGKKWRRSFIVLKNIRDFGLNWEALENENKGRCHKQNIKNLICSQQNVEVLKEIEECNFEDQIIPGFEEGDTLETNSRSKGARFSLCVSANPISSREITHSSFLHERTLTWCAHDLSESVIHNVPAGDTSRDATLPLIDRGIPYSAREITLNYCKQSEPLAFEDCFPESSLQNCEKIGEGVYGEVFLLKKNSRKRSVLKIIPIEGDQLVNGERQKKFDEILSELVITFELSNLKNRSDYYTNCFAEVQRCRCVYGKYPPRLLTLWKEYDVKKGSDNDSPKIFKSDQLYLILELNHGGKDLESTELSNALQAFSVFNQVVHALAVAEKAFMFEHRDLHWGNILVSSTQNEETMFIFNKQKQNVKLHGVKVTIIDYTLSRMSIRNRTLYNNIGQDPELFNAEGDFQFEVYRLMRKEVKNIWDQFEPRTNILWLYYLLDKLINEVRYRISNTRNNIKIHRKNLVELKELYRTVRNFSSCYDFIVNRFSVNL